MNDPAFASLQHKIRQCTACVELGHIPEANPILFGNPTARIMVLGQAPGPTAKERPLPYSGASGRTLQGWLSQAGFEEGSLYDPDRFYLTSITKCFPGRSTSGNGDRAPSRAEIDLCSTHLDAELRWVQPELILCLGRISISTMLASLRRHSLGSIVGNVYNAEYTAAGGALILPLPHPSGVSRWHNDPANKRQLNVALDQLARERLHRNL